MSVLEDITKTLKQFQAALNEKDVQTSKRLLAQLKLKLTELPSLPPTFQPTPNADQELLLAREVLEHGVFLSILMQDEAIFERNYLQLNTYYTDTRTRLPPSSREHLIVGLNLLRLLVQNRIAEFHTDLELMTPEVQASDFVSQAVGLEQWLMEGAYNKVLEARRIVPDASYAYFLDKLLATVRDEIASCSERAYASLSVAEAKKLMLFTSDQEAARYAEQRGWAVRDGAVHFSAKAEAEEEAAAIPALGLINNALTYARELERIV